MNIKKKKKKKKNKKKKKKKRKKEGYFILLPNEQYFRNYGFLVDFICSQYFLRNKFCRSTNFLNIIGHNFCCP